MTKKLKIAVLFSTTLMVLSTLGGVSTIANARRYHHVGVVRHGWVKPARHGHKFAQMMHDPKFMGKLYNYSTSGLKDTVNDSSLRLFNKNYPDSPDSFLNNRKREGIGKRISHYLGINRRMRRRDYFRYYRYFNDYLMITVPESRYIFSHKIRPQLIRIAEDVNHHHRASKTDRARARAVHHLDQEETYLVAPVNYFYSDGPSIGDLEPSEFKKEIKEALRGRIAYLHYDINKLVYSKPTAKLVWKSRDLDPYLDPYGNLDES